MLNIKRESMREGLLSTFKSQMPISPVRGLLDYIAGKREYRYVNVIAFSFGSVVAIDNIFPAGWKPVPRTQIINNLVTIGCPFDLFRMMWKHYFDDRMLLPGVPSCRINVYSPLDILGSNFRDDEKMAEAKVSISADHKTAVPRIESPLPREPCIYWWNQSQRCKQNGLDEPLRSSRSQHVLESPPSRGN